MEPDKRMLAMIKDYEELVSDLEDGKD